MKLNVIKLAKWTGWTVIGLVAIYVAALLITGAKLRNAQADIEAAGCSTRSEQVIPPPVDDTNNAALLYQAAVLRLKAESVNGTSLFKQLNNLSPKSYADSGASSNSNALAQLLGNATVIEALRLVEAGAARPACRYDLEYDRGFEMRVPHVTDLLSLSRILSGSMRLDAARGDTAAVWRTAETALSLSDALKSEPILISCVVRASQTWMTCEAIRAVCGITPPGDQVREQLDGIIARMESSSSLSLALDGERVLGSEKGFDHIASGKKEPLVSLDDIPKFAVYVMRFPPLFQYDRTIYRRSMLEFRNRSTRPTWEMVSADVNQPMDNRIPRLCILSRMVIPCIDGLFSKEVERITSLRLTRAALAVTAYRQKTGVWPKDLVAAGCGALIDPFTGKPMIYRLTDQGPAVYSIGGDLKDDGGKIWDRTTRKGDLVWQP